MISQVSACNLETILWELLENFLFNLAESISTEIQNDYNQIQDLIKLFSI